MPGSASRIRGGLVLMLAWVGAGLAGTGCAGWKSLSGEDRVTSRPAAAAPARPDLPALNPRRVDPWLVRSEAGRFGSGPERTLVQAREAYWEGRTDDALRLWRELLPETARSPVPADVLRWWMIAACEDARRWDEVVRLAGEFGFDRSHPDRFRMARTLGREPVPSLEFSEPAPAHPFELKSRHWIVTRAEIHGREARVLVDTGFSQSLVTAAFADRAGVRMLGGAVDITDTHGRSRPAGVGILESLSIAGLTARRWPVVVGPLESLEGGTGPLDGVIGWDLLRQATVTWDFPALILALEPPGKLAGGSPVISGRRAPMLECMSPDGRPLDLFLDTGYASSPSTVVLHANAGLLDSKVDRKRFSRSLKPSFGAGLHSWRMRWPRRSRDLVLGFDGHEFVMPLALRRSDVSVMEGMQTCDGMIGVAPFLGGSLRLDASVRAARYLPGTAPVPPGR